MVRTPAGEAAFAEFSLRPGNGLPMRESAQPACQPAAGGESRASARKPTPMSVSIRMAACVIAAACGWLWSRSPHLP